MGDPSGRRALLADYPALHQAPMVPHDEVAAFVRQRRLHGQASRVSRATRATVPTTMRA